MSTVKKDPVLEAMARKLAGYDGVPADERIKMLKRCAKAGYDAIQREHGRNQSEMLADIRALRDVAASVQTLNQGGVYTVKVLGDDEPCFAQRKEWVDWMMEISQAALTKTEKYV